MDGVKIDKTFKRSSKLTISLNCFGILYVVESVEHDVTRDVTSCDARMISRYTSKQFVKSSSMLSMRRFLGVTSIRQTCAKNT